LLILFTEFDLIRTSLYCISTSLFNTTLSFLSFILSHSAFRTPLYYSALGITVMALYVTFVMIILLNLIIARMSSTHEKINDKSFEQWSMVMAKNVQDCLLINEKVKTSFF
jgi:hypothetical protein